MGCYIRVVKLVCWQRAVCPHLQTFNTLFCFHIFYFYLFVSKKAARVGYTNIISSLSLRLASVLLWFSNSASRNCTRLVVHSNDILYILLVRVCRRTHVRTMHIYFRATIYVLETILCRLHLEVVNTFSNDVYIVVLYSVNEIRFFHVVFVFSCCYSISCSYLYHGCPYGAGCTTKRTDTYKATPIAALLCICKFSRSLSLLRVIYLLNHIRLYLYRKRTTCLPPLTPPLDKAG